MDHHAIDSMRDRVWWQSQVADNKMFYLGLSRAEFRI